MRIIKGIRIYTGIAAVSIALLSVNANCNKNADNGGTEPGNPDANGPIVSSWMTTGDQQHLLEKQTGVTQFKTGAADAFSITVDTATGFQEIDGFGYSLTGGSAQVIHQLPAAARQSLLQELFGKNENSIGVSYLRISIGASDLDPEVFSYDDIPAGQTDEDLSEFNLSRDTVHLIPVLKEILAINPNVKLMGSPWSPPVWMKDNKNSKGGTILPVYYEAYANYFVKYIQAMQALGISINAITPQNEPLHPGNNPSMLFPATDEAAFIRDHLGPAFAAANINTKIIVYDHNCDKPDYPLTILNDAAARKFVAGSAFHLYAGDISALTAVHNAYPDKGVYFTEQWTGANSSFDGDLRWHVKNVIIGSVNNFSKLALEWNLASDPSYDPHTAGGCTECKGALTISSGGTIKKNVSWYIIGHASKFVPPGSVRVKTTSISDIAAAAFLTPDNKKVLVLVNDGTVAKDFNIVFKNQRFGARLDAGAVATYTW